MKIAFSLLIALVVACGRDGIPTSAPFGRPALPTRQGPRPLHPADFASHSGAIEILDTLPRSVKGGALESNTKIFAFGEKHGLVLPGGVLFDLSEAGVWATGSSRRGGVPAGTRIDVHFLHADRESGPRDIHLRGSVRFHAEILGVIYTSSKLEFNDDPLGLPDSVDYPVTGDRNSSDRERGLELGRDSLRISADRRTLEVVMNVDTQLDQLRVITSAEGDVTPPTVLDFEVTPLIVNVKDDPTVQLMITASDVDSGLHLITLYLDDPRYPDFGKRIIKRKFFDGEKSATHTFVHDFLADGVLPYPGLWPVSGFVEDRAGNRWEFTGIDPAHDQLGSGGVEVTLCGESITPRDGNVRGVTFGALRTTALRSLSEDPFNVNDPGTPVLTELRSFQDQMNLHEGWNRFLYDQDILFRTRYCDAIGALQGTRSGDEAEREAAAVLFSEIAAEMSTMIDTLEFRSLLLQRDIEDFVVATIEGEAYRTLLEMVQRADRHRSFRLFWGADDASSVCGIPQTSNTNAEDVKACVDLAGNLSTLGAAAKVVAQKVTGEAAGRASVASILFFVKDIVSIAVNISSAALILQENRWIESDLTQTFYELQELGLQMRLLQLKHVELREEEVTVCGRLAQTTKRLMLQGYPAEEVSCG